MGICALCGKPIEYTIVLIKNKGDNEYHPDCAKEVRSGIEEELFKRLIADGMIPKTYRSIFELYLRWRERQDR